MQCELECAGQLGQCGGDNWHGATCCKYGYKCMKKNQWYHECRPPWLTSVGTQGLPQRVHSGIDGSTGDCWNVRHTSTAPKCAQALKQCGGQRFTGAKCCVGAYKCERKNRWYSQCRTRPFRKPRVEEDEED